MKNKTNGLANLAKKVTAIFGAALAGISGGDALASNNTQINNSDKNFSENTIRVSSLGKTRPMPVLKFNPANPSNSLLVASHGSHRSHSSHSSHSSHYSHRSGY